MSEEERLALLEQQFLQDARSALADAGVDLLEFEVAGEGVEPELLGRLARLAQSMRGGSGLLGLVTCGELALYLEVVLELLRRKLLVADAGVVRAIEKGMDALGAGFDSAYADVTGTSPDAAMHNPLHADEHSDVESVLGADILAETLRTIALEALPAGERDLMQPDLVLRRPDGSRLFELSGLDLMRARDEGLRFYVVCFDPERDLRAKELSPFGLLSFLQKSGHVIDARFAPEDGGDAMLLHVLYATILEPDFVEAVFQVAAWRIHVVDLVAAGDAKPAWALAERPAPALVAPLAGVGGSADDASLQKLISQFNAAMESLREQGMHESFVPYNEDDDAYDTVAPDVSSVAATYAMQDAAMTPPGAALLQAEIEADPAAADGLLPDWDASSVSPDVRPDVSPAVNPDVNPDGAGDVVPRVATDNALTFSLQDPAAFDAATPDAAMPTLPDDDALEAHLAALEAEMEGVLQDDDGSLPDVDPFTDVADAAASAAVTDATQTTAAASGDDAFAMTDDDPDAAFFRDDAPPPDLSYLSLPDEAEARPGFMLDLDETLEGVGHGGEPAQQADDSALHVPQPAASVDAAAVMVDGSEAPSEVTAVSAAVSVAAAHAAVAASAPETPAPRVDAPAPAEAVVSAVAAASETPAVDASILGTEELEGFTLEVTDDGGILLLHGEVTIERSAQLREALLDVLSRFASVQLDMTRVEAADISFLQLLRAAVQTASARRVSLAARGALAPAIVALVERAGLDGAAIRHAGMEAVLPIAETA